MKALKSEPGSDYALTVVFDSWMRLTALFEASASILEEAGYELADATAAVDRGDRALVALLRRDRLEERHS